MSHGLFAVSNVTLGVLLGVRHLHLAGNKDIFCRLDLAVKSVQKVAVEADRVEHNFLVGVPLKVRWERGRVDLLVLDISTANTEPTS